MPRDTYVSEKASSSPLLSNTKWSLSFSYFCVVSDEMNFSSVDMEMTAYLEISSK